MRKRLATLLLFAIISWENSDAQQSTAKANWKTLDETAYSIQYPNDWTLDTSHQMGIRFILFAPKESDQDKGKENVNLLTNHLKNKNLDLDDYTELSLAQIKEFFTNSEIIENKRMKNASGEYQCVIYTADQGVFHLKWEAYCWLVNDSAYTLTLTCEQDKFDQRKEIGERILNSFVIKK